MPSFGMRQIGEVFSENMKKSLDTSGELIYLITVNAGWSSPVARRAHNPKAVGSNPTPATNEIRGFISFYRM